MCHKPPSLKTQAYRAKHEEALCKRVNAQGLLVSTFSILFLTQKDVVTGVGLLAVTGRDVQLHGQYLLVSISSRETTVGGPGFITYHFELALHLT